MHICMRNKIPFKQKVDQPNIIKWLNGINCSSQPNNKANLICIYKYKSVNMCVERVHILHLTFEVITGSLFNKQETYPLYFVCRNVTLLMPGYSETCFLSESPGSYLTQIGHRCLGQISPRLNKPGLFRTPGRRWGSDGAFRRAGHQLNRSMK